MPAMPPLDGSESLVIDCSVTMAWYFKDQATPYTNAVRAALASHRAAVPALWPLEVANVLLMGERRKRSTQTKAAPTVKQHLAAIGMLFDWLTRGGIIAFNPAASVSRSQVRRQTRQDARADRRLSPAVARQHRHRQLDRLTRPGLDCRDGL